jgi:hypothetical protein
MGVLALVAVVVLGVGGYVVVNGRSGAAQGDEPSGTTATPQPSTPAPAATAQSTAVVTQLPETTATSQPPPATRPTPVPDRRPSRPAGRQPTPTRSTPPPVVQTPVPPPAVEQGFLTIDADPAGEVFIDGVDVGSTPLFRQPLKVGKHTVRVEAPGYKTVTQSVQVDPGNTVNRRITMIPE